MDPTTILTITQSISTTQVISGSVSIGTSAIMLAVSPAQMFGVMLGYLLILGLFLFSAKFQQWALILALISTLAWLPLSVTGLSLIASVVAVFFLMIATLLRTLGNFWK
jgi:ABC-type polysaccharide/polyol phosphate export permease